MAQKNFPSYATSRISTFDVDGNGNAISSSGALIADTTLQCGDHGSYPSVLLKDAAAPNLPTAAEAPAVYVDAANTAGCTVNATNGAIGTLNPVVFVNPMGRKVDLQGNIIIQQQQKAKN